MRKGSFAIGCILMFGCSASAADLGVRDINVGMPKTEVIEKLKSHKRVKCYEDKNFCEEDAWIKRAVKLTYSFGKSTGKLVSIDLWYLNRFNDVMLEGLKEKYGEPTTTRKTVWQNRLGANFDNTEVFWLNSGGSVIMRHIGKDINSGEISILSNLIEEEIAAEKKIAAKEPGF